MVGMGGGGHLLAHGTSSCGALVVGARVRRALDELLPVFPPAVPVVDHVLLAPPPARALSSAPSTASTQRHTRPAACDRSTLSPNGWFQIGRCPFRNVLVTQKKLLGHSLRFTRRSAPRWFRIGRVRFQTRRNRKVSPPSPSAPLAHSSLPLSHTRALTVSCPLVSTTGMAPGPSSSSRCRGVVDSAG
jgi:hypothetical protein